MNYCTASLSMLVISLCIPALKTGMSDDNMQMYNILNTRVRRVIGPHKVEPHSKPWSVFLLMNENRMCGSFLLDVRSLNLSIPIERLPPAGSSDVIITASHCVSESKFVYRNATIYYADSPYAFVAYFGVHNVYNSSETRVNRSSINVIMHESYKRDYRYYNDIALIRLEKPVEIGDQIQSLQITSHPTSQMRNCSISGWGGNSGDLTMAFLENNHDIPQANQTAATVSNESNTIFGDSGSAIVCYADGDFFAHGVHSMGYNNTKDIEYANLYMLGPWLKSSLIDLYDITLFHSALHHYAVGGMDSTMAHLEMAYIFLAFMNSAPPGFDIELEVEHVEYRKMWTEHDIGKHILIENDSFNWKNLSGYTLEKDVYHCAIACFIRNNKDSKPLAAKGTEKTRKHNLHPFNCQCDPSVYVSFERRKFHVCPALLISQSGLGFDKAAISVGCLDLLVKPYKRSWPEVLRSLFINVRINKTTIKQATVQLNYDLTMKYHSGIATLVLDITGMIPFGEVRRTDIGKNNDFISEPRVLYFNVFMGGHQYIPFSRPWMVLLENDSGPVCQGVFIDNSIMGKNLTKLGFVLTTTECADMLPMEKSRARFGVHFSGIESLYEQTSDVYFIGKPIGNESHSDFALLGVKPIQINDAVSPLSLSETLDSHSRSDNYVYGWNLKCPNPGTPHVIPMHLSMNNTALYIYGRPSLGFDGTCNQKHHAGRPLMRCTSNNEKCVLLGLSTQISKVQGGYVNEQFLNITSYLPSVRSTMKSMEDVLVEMMNQEQPDSS